MQPRSVLIASMIFLLAACSGVPANNSTRSSGTSISRTGELNLTLAESYLQTNDLKNALDRAHLILKTDPNAAEAYAMLGLIYDRKGDQEKAESSFKSALKLAPTKGPVLNAYGVWLCQQRRFTEAELQLDKALQDPVSRGSRQQVLYNAGKCAQQAGWREKAENHFRNALALAPNEPKTLFALAEVELSLGKIMQARAFIQRREEVNVDANVLALAAAIEDAAGNPGAAARYRQRMAQGITQHEPGIATPVVEQEQ